MECEHGNPGFCWHGYSQEFVLLHFSVSLYLMFV